MKSPVIRVGIVGCGKIFPAHLDAINNNPTAYKLVAVCDSDRKVLARAVGDNSAVPFLGYDKMLSGMTGKMDMVVIATPNALHYPQAVKAIKAGYDILVEKPVAFDKEKVMKIVSEAKRLRRKAYAVLQVRYNPSIAFLKEAIEEKLLGKIRLVSLTLRWQRPKEYFLSWRGNIKIGGRILYEVGIHYLDIIQWIFGLPKTLSTNTFRLKHKNINFEDTVFSDFIFENGAVGHLEVTLAAEPTNLECSISVIGENGFIKVGGLALNKIDCAEFLKNNKQADKFKKELGVIVETKPNNYGKYQGSSPNHPVLYREIAEGRGISMGASARAIDFIEKIYRAENYLTK